jgi:hypothetical protein
MTRTKLDVDVPNDFAENGGSLAILLFKVQSIARVASLGVRHPTKP